MAPLSVDPARPVGLVLSGGGARGAFQVGVWEVLSEHPEGIGRHPLVVSGTSAGALNGTLIAAGLSPRAMLDFWIDLGQRPPIVAHEGFYRSLRAALGQLALREPLREMSLRTRDLRIIASLLRKHRFYRPSGLGALLVEFLLTARFDSVSHLLERVTATYLFDTSPLRERLIRAIGGETVPRGRVRLAINAVDVRTGGVVRIVNHPPEKSSRSSISHYRYVPEIPVDLVVASAAIPVLFNPVAWNGELLWDGGLLVNSPMAPAVALGAKRIVPVLVTKEDTRPRDRIDTMGEALERVVDTLLENAYNIDRKLLLARNELVGRVAGEDSAKVELFRAVRPESTALFGAGSYLHFEKSALLAMYDAGKRAARAWLARGPEHDLRSRDA